MNWLSPNMDPVTIREMPQNDARNMKYGLLFKIDIAKNTMYSEISK